MDTTKGRRGWSGAGSCHSSRRSRLPTQRHLSPPAIGLAMPRKQLNIHRLRVSECDDWRRSRSWRMPTTRGCVGSCGATLLHRQRSFMQKARSPGTMRRSSPTPSSGCMHPRQLYYITSSDQCARRRARRRDFPGDARGAPRDLSGAVCHVCVLAAGGTSITHPHSSSRGGGGRRDRRRWRRRGRGAERRSAGHLLSPWTTL